MKSWTSRAQRFEMAKRETEVTTYSNITNEETKQLTFIETCESYTITDDYKSNIKHRLEQKSSSLMRLKWTLTPCRNQF